ncbi:ectonucleotide pyrophosphatase/phosphodiesterase family member 1-like, partial [Brachionichthys hirsutus]|uniref:ectonucleotide pyrophosphatase/phosphodiesterase family member 1-like n=1 Tax=Brachionichthys hirsutus TaxID=412623 RepID=UPI003604B783
MEASKGEDASPEQATSPFVAPEAEAQISHAGGGKKRIKCLVITGVLLLCFLALILTLTLPQKESVDENGGDLWLQQAGGELQEPQCPPGFSRPPLILISLDGLRARYLKDHSRHLPVINKLRRCGTTTPNMRPVYPTKTFPNHYSIATGLYPESHGIVGNKMYDVTRDAFFSLKTKEKFDPRWYRGEPVWHTAMRQKLKVGTYFWPGSDAPVNGTLPNYHKLYNGSIPFQERVSTLLEWLSLPQGERPDFYTLYLEEPDASGHRHGPGSAEVVRALENVDKILGLLMDGLLRRDLHRCANVIVLSDHGMEEASCDKAAFVSDYQNETDDFTVIQGPAARIRPSDLPENFFSFDYEGLVKNLSCKLCANSEQKMRPYLKENLPKRMHFANNVRIERGHLYMREGWQAALNVKEIKYCTGGFHGSDNLFPNMQAIFIGYGPAFKSDTVVPPFENIEVYNLMCDLLNIRPAPNNGTHGSLNHLLKHPVHLPGHPAQLSHDTPCDAAGHAPAEDVGCNCGLQTQAAEADMNKHLLSVEPSMKAILRRLHHPFGTPRVVQPEATFCVLHHVSYLNGYSKDRRMPLWVSYTVQPL